MEDQKVDTGSSSSTSPAGASETATTAPAAGTGSSSNHVSSGDPVTSSSLPPSSSSSPSSPAQGSVLLIEAEKLKDEGNACFKNQDYQEAVCLYTRAIDLSPTSAVYHANRSIANLRLENFGYALEDANRCLELDANYVKGYYRRAAAFMALGKFKGALRDFEAVVRVRPTDQDAKKKVMECAKIVKQAAFAKAIAVDDSVVRKSVAESINVDVMSIEASYTGPKLPDPKKDADVIKESGNAIGITIDFMKEMIDSFKHQKRLHKRFAFQIILAADVILKSCATLVDIQVTPESKFTVCGDIHGQFFDLINIFTQNGLPSRDNPYLFNGDFVDRGSFSVECILVLFAFKVMLPDSFFLARGNHESMTMNQMYGFEGEVKSKYSPQMYDLFAEVFNHLPLAHCINGKVLVMHGGLFSNDDVTLSDIRKTDRFRQPPDEGIMCELLWSDPMPASGRAPSKRGVGIQFGPDITARFLSKNKLDYVIRSHEVKSDGYEVAHEGKCITVFSAPNYCDTMGNKGAFITMNGNDLRPNFHTYTEVPHPDVKPMAYASSLFNFM